MLFAALILVLLFPGVFQKVSQASVDSPGKTVLVGFATSILVPVTVVLLMITVIGIPVALLFGLLWLAIVASSGPFAAYYTGRLVLSKTKVKNSILYMLLGAVILLALNMIPILGFLIDITVLWFGLGMILLTLFRHYKKPAYKVK
jgi:hypothetical protein